MIDKRDVQAFFDRLAPGWDAGMVRNEAVIARILDNAGVCEGCTVLDVACGTGVLFGDYVKRGAARVTAVDLSPEMAARAADCSARFLLLPVPLPQGLPLSRTSTSNFLSWSGPDSPMSS